MKIDQLAQAQEAYILEKRRYFHQYPELSWLEKDATCAIATEMGALGYTVHLFPDHTGLWADIEGTKATAHPRTLMLRADLDALPITENTGLPFESVRKGVMHACGHDSHTAMLMGAARMLSEIRDQFSGSIRLLFQPAEEINEGARYCITQGVLQNVDAVLGLHVWGDLEAPYLNIQDGPRMASCDIFRIRVNGVSAHGGTPHQGVDAIVAASAIVLQIQSIVSRNNDPREPLVLTVGELHGGKRFNIIADTVEMVGTVRALSQTIRMQVEGRLRKKAENTAAAYGATVDIQYDYLAQPVVNRQPDLVKLAQASAEKLYGNTAIRMMPPLMASEDFAYYLEQVPGVFCFLGAQKGMACDVAKNHSERFTVDESVLVRGAAFYAQFALDYLA